jgi:hypothetical protein
MCDYLGRDFTKKSSEDSSSPLLLTDDEETTLIFILKSVVGIQTKTKSQAKMNRVLIDWSEKLLEKYCSDFNNPQRLEQVLKIVQHIELEYFIDLRMIPAFEQLFDMLIRVFSTHENRYILTSIAETLGNFIAENNANGDPNPISATSVRIYEEFISSEIETLIEYVRVAKDTDIVLGFDIEIFKPIVRKTLQIKLLSDQNISFFKMPAIINCRIDEIVGFYPLMNFILDLCLQIIKINDGVEASIMCVSLHHSSLEIMKNETIYSLLQLSKLPEDKRLDTEISELETKIKRYFYF